VGGTSDKIDEIFDKIVVQVENYNQAMSVRSENIESVQQYNEHFVEPSETPYLSITASDMDEKNEGEWTAHEDITRTIHVSEAFNLPSLDHTARAKESYQGAANFATPAPKSRSPSGTTEEDSEQSSDDSACTVTSVATSVMSSASKMSKSIRRKMRLKRTREAKRQASQHGMTVVSKCDGSSIAALSDGWEKLNKERKRLEKDKRNFQKKCQVWEHKARGSKF
jgi:hypothetical protein